MFGTDITRITDGSDGLSQDELLMFMFLSRYKKTTATTYKIVLRSFYEWCQQYNLNLLDVKRVHAQLYVEFLKTKPWKNSSVLQNITVCRTFYSLLEADDMVVRNPFNHLSLPRMHQHEIKRPHLNRTQFCDLLEYCKTQSPKKTVMVMMLGVMGLRASELCSLDTDSISDYEHGYQMVRFTGKGDKPANLPMPIMVSRWMDTYLQQYPRTEGPLFTTIQGNRYTRTGLSGLIHDTCRQAGVPPVRAHALRRSMVTNSLNAGADMREVQKAARHSDLRTTSRIYDQGTIAHDSSSMNVLAGYISGAL